MKSIYLLTILFLISLMSYEFWSFNQHYDALIKEVQIIKSVCKVDLGPKDCTKDSCPI